MRPLIAVDVGNSRIKLGWYESVAAGTYSEPTATLQLAVDPWAPAALGAWKDSFRTTGDDSGQPLWLIASVNRKATTALVTWVQHDKPGAPVRELLPNDLPLRVTLPSPQRVGMDRLAAAVAVNRLRSDSRPAVVVDVGTAITVDVVSDRGAFLGGAILPGIAMSARALAEQTEALPRLAFDQLDRPPAPLGTSTAKAIEAGLFWGAIGAMRELIGQLAANLPTMPEVFLTGGAAPPVAGLLGVDARYVANLVLGGIILAHSANRP